MPTASEIRQVAFSIGRTKKRNNAWASLFCGAVPGLVLAHYLHTGPGRWLLGTIIGLIWGNAFEYCYHRWLLHRPQTSFGRGHIEHHRTVGTPAEAEHVTFGDSPLRVAALFFTNSLLLIPLEHWVKLGLAPGILIGWAIYMIAVEEIHWRVHLGGWLPPGLALARVYHLAHHDVADGRFNVFFPLFDLLLGNIRPPMNEIVLPPVVEPAPAARIASSAVLVYETVLYLWLWVLAIDRHFLPGPKA